MLPNGEESVDVDTIMMTICQQTAGCTVTAVQICPDMSYSHRQIFTKVAEIIKSILFF